MVRYSRHLDVRHTAPSALKKSRAHDGRSQQTDARRGSLVLGPQHLGQPNVSQSSNRMLGTPGSSRALQPAGAEAVFAAHARVQRAPPPPRVVGEELVAQPGGSFRARSAERHTLSPPSGTFNFVRVRGDTPRNRPVLISAKLAHAQLADGRPVIYAGTANFARGEMAWWSNYSGTYQPIAAFRAQAGLPEDKFVPWQKLQMGGTAMQRGTFTERRAVEPAARPEAPKAADRPNGAAAQTGTVKEGAKPVAGPISSTGGMANAGASSKPAAGVSSKPAVSAAGAKSAASGGGS